MTTEQLLAAVTADTMGFVGPAYQVQPLADGVIVTVDHWEGQYRVTGHSEGRVRIAGPALVGSVPESHIQVVEA